MYAVRCCPINQCHSLRLKPARRMYVMCACFVYVEILYTCIMFISTKNIHIFVKYNNTYIIYLCSFSAISKVEKYGNLGRVPELNSKQFLFVRESCLSMSQEETTLSGVTYLKIQSHFCGSMFFHLRQLIPIRSNFLCDMDIFRLPWKHITTKDLPRDFGYLRTQKFVLPFPYHPGIWYTYCTYMYHKNQPNVGKYAIHGSYGSEILYTAGGNQRI